MIRVITWWGSSNEASGVRIEGHASFAPHGQDIVCAAVSALTHTTIMAMQEYLFFDPLTEKDEGCMEIVIPGDLGGEKREQAMLLTKSMVLGLKKIAETYPDCIEIIEA